MGTRTRIAIGSIATVTLAATVAVVKLKQPGPVAPGELLPRVYAGETVTGYGTVPSGRYMLIQDLKRFPFSDVHKPCRQPLDTPDDPCYIQLSATTRAIVNNCWREVPGTSPKRWEIEGSCQAQRAMVH